MRHKALVSSLVAALVLGYAMLCAAGVESKNHRIPRSVQSAGGAFMVSNNYAAGATLAQASAIGQSSSTSYVVHAGFWVPILIKGDVNGDGKVDLADLIVSLLMLVGISPSGVHRGADLNGDGQIGLGEVIYILGKIAGLRD